MESDFDDRLRQFLPKTQTTSAAFAETWRKDHIPPLDRQVTQPETHRVAPDSPGGRPRNLAEIWLGPYFTVPKGLFSSGIGASMGPSAIAVYTALCHHLNDSRRREQQHTVAVSDKALAADTGVSERNLRNIRIKLSASQLVKIFREPGQSYRYTLQSVEWQRIKLEDRLRPKRGRRGLHSHRQIEG